MGCTRGQAGAEGTCVAHDAIRASAGKSLLFNTACARGRTVAEEPLSPLSDPNPG